MSARLISFWVVGAALLFAAGWILSNVRPGPGVSDTTFLVMLGLSFVLILLAGLAWISVAVATRRNFL